MELYKREICGDCIHHKMSGDGIICSLSNDKPNYQHNCRDFNGNDNWINRYKRYHQATIDENDSQANWWLGIGSVIAIVLLIIVPILNNYVSSYLCIALAILIIAYSLYKYISLHKIIKQIETKIIMTDAQNSYNRSNNRQEPIANEDDTITIDRTIQFLKDIGYAPSYNGVDWIRVIYGNIPIFISYSDNVLQVATPFEFEDDMNDPVSIHNFLLASNNVMVERRFVQITQTVNGCMFAISSFVQSYKELCNVLPTYFRVIDESIDRHRQLYIHYMSNSEASKEQVLTTDTHVN